MNIHCSACGAPLPPGARFCPACALPLIAIAMPTPVPRRKQTPLWLYALCGFGIFFVIVSALDADSRAKRDTAVAAFTADVQANGKLATPEAFQAACGKAEESARAGGITVLTYSGYRMYFQPGKAVDMRRLTGSAWEQPMDADVIFDRLQCKIG
jgi:hypothetical protein